MIGDVHRALRGLLAPLLPAGCQVRIGPPDAGVATAADHDRSGPAGAATGPGGGRPGPALVLFLADVREDEKAAGTDWTDVRDADGGLIGRRPPIRRFRLQYLITACDADAEVEADLLDTVLTAVDPGRRLDPALLGDSLADGPVVLRLAEDAAAAYARLGLPPRTVIGVTADVPLILPLDTDLAPPADQITMDVGRPRRGVPAGSGAGPAGSGAGPAGSGAGPAGSGAGPAGARRQWRGSRIVERDTSPAGGDHAVRREDG